MWVRMLQACIARGSVVVGITAVALLGRTAFADPNQPPPVIVEKPAAASAAKPRTGVKIELTVPRIPGVTSSKSDGKDAQGKAGSKSWPKTLPEAQAEKEAKSKPPAQWTPQEVADGRARCAAILKRIHAVAIAQEPIKEGICGTPAPIQLVSIGQNPQVALDPPATVNCDFAESLESWIEQDVQPLAQKHVGGNVIKIEVMSSYSCRNAYGRAGNKLSEHGIANALDIRGFVTSAGTSAYVLEDWGTPQREILARIAAEKAKAAKALAEAQAAEKAAQEAQATSHKTPAGTPPSSTASSAGAPAAGIARSTISDGLPKLTVTLPGASRSSEDSPRESFSLSPNRLGGPKDAKDEKATSSKNAPKPSVPRAAGAPFPDAGAKSKNLAVTSDRKQAFLHSVHASACRRFGTTLGPEANAAHRNHLHVDMAVRKTDTKICDH